MADGKIKNQEKAHKAVKSGKKAASPKYETTSIEKTSSMVEESSDTAYVTNKRQISNGINNWVILDNASKKPESRMTSFEKIDIIREGISKKDLEHLKEKTDLDYNQLSKVLSVARATLINKKGAAKFDMVLSERIVGVADIYSYGYEVFEDENRFNEWIFRSNQSLGGQAPYDLLDNQYGREEVKNLIGRIDYGVYS
jgi:putative toxin-antitoxin system antitoxin component (TIGR02293 family)